jgi:hypothetical protein
MKPLVWAVAWSPSGLWHGHRLGCGMVTIWAVAWLLSGLWHGHHLGCGMVTNQHRPIVR